AISIKSFEDGKIHLNTLLFGLPEKLGDVTGRPILPGYLSLAIIPFSHKLEDGLQAYLVAVKSRDFHYMGNLSGTVCQTALLYQDIYRGCNLLPDGARGQINTRHHYHHLQTA